MADKSLELFAVDKALLDSTCATFRFGESGNTADPDESGGALDLLSFLMIESEWRADLRPLRRNELLLNDFFSLDCMLLIFKNAQMKSNEDDMKRIS